MAVASFSHVFLVLELVTQMNVQLADEPVEKTARDKKVPILAVTTLQLVAGFDTPTDGGHWVPIVMPNEIIISHFSGAVAQAATVGIKTPTLIEISSHRRVWQRATGITLRKVVRVIIEQRGMTVGVVRRHAQPVPIKIRPRLKFANVLKHKPRRIGMILCEIIAGIKPSHT